MKKLIAAIVIIVLVAAAAALVCRSHSLDSDSNPSSTDSSRGGSSTASPTAAGTSGASPSAAGTSGASPSAAGTSGASPSAAGTSGASPTAAGTSGASPSVTSSSDGNTSGTSSADEERLKALPYLSYSTSLVDGSKMGVVISYPGKYADGLNFFCSMPRGEAYLMDMKGFIQKTWHNGSKLWQAATLDKSGNVFFIVLDEALVKTDWNSRVIWESRGRYHNCISIAENGDILTLMREVLRISHGKGKGKVPILNDLLTILSPDGKVKKKISMYKIFGDIIPEARLNQIAASDQVTVKDEKRDVYDVFHSNAVSRIERDVPGLCRKGDLLISVRELNTIAIIDPVTEKLRWKWGETMLDSQHFPVLLDSGHILVLDNGRMERDYSRVVELDPIRREIVYEYKAGPPQSFYTAVGGSVQELSNGDLLVTETDTGRVFEITYKNDTVWEFYNKNLNDSGTQRETIPSMLRLKPAETKAMWKRIEEERRESARAHSAEPEQKSAR